MSAIESNNDPRSVNMSNDAGAAANNQVINNNAVPLEAVGSNTSSWTELKTNPRLLMVVLFGTIGGLLFGYDIGVIGGVTASTEWREKMGIDLQVDGKDTSSAADITSWVVSSFLLGCAAAAIVTGPIADYYSRKHVILWGSIIFTIGGILQATCYDLSQIIIGRVVAGLAIGALSTVIPMYNSEISSSSVRGISNSLFQLAITAGILLAFLCNLGLKYVHWGWRLTLGIQSLLSLFLIFGISFLPESPRFLMFKRREADAVAVLKRIRNVQPVDPERAEAAIIAAATGGAVDENGKAVIDFTTFNRPVPRTPENNDEFNIVKLPTNTLEQEIEEIRASIIHEEKLGQAGWKDLFGTPMRARVTTGVGVQGWQQLTGMNAISYYSNTIFYNVGIESTITTAIVGVINMFVTFFAIGLVDSYGRVPLLLWGAVGMMISTLIVGICGLYGDSGALGICIVVFVCVFVACFAVSSGPVGWIIPSEIFPLTIRAKGVSLTTTVNWLGNFGISMAVPQLLAHAGTGPTFLLFFAFECMIIIFVMTLVPETKKVSLEQMDRIFSVETLPQFRQYVFNNFKNGLSILSLGSYRPDGEIINKQREANYLANKERNSGKKAETWTKANLPQGSMELPPVSAQI